jgi:hypothetical protein
MTVGVDVYRTDDYVRHGRIELVDMLRAVFQDVVGDGQPAAFMLHFHAIADAREVTGAPSVVNLKRSHGYVTVRIARDGRVIYQHPHSVREIIGRPLQALLAKERPEETHWGFGVSGLGLETVALERPAPAVEGSIDLRVRGPRRRQFHMEAVPEPSPPEITLAELGGQGSGSGSDMGHRIGVVLTPTVYETLQREMELSNEVEEGGFLVGRLYRDRESNVRQLIHVTHALPAERTGASLLHFTFTGESFLRINEAVGQLGDGTRLAGWYHTHLFPATAEVGLSTIDVELHTRTFLRPWHLAGLINLDRSARQLRFYGWDGDRMRQLPFWVGEPWTR